MGDSVGNDERGVNASPYQGQDHSHNEDDCRPTNEVDREEDAVWKLRCSHTLYLLFSSSSSSKARTIDTVFTVVSEPRRVV
jgi:hypothetical protein